MGDAVEMPVDLPADHVEQSLAHDCKLIVKTSTLPLMGRGLFVKRRAKEFKKGQVIAEYKGNRLTKEELDALYGAGAETLAPYAIAASADVIIDAAAEDMSNKARYANDCLPNTTTYIKLASHGKILCEPNAMFWTNHEQRLFIVATQSIPPGAEVFVSYGKEFWGTPDQQIERLLYEHMLSASQPNEPTTKPNNSDLDGSSLLLDRRYRHFDEAARFGARLWTLCELVVALAGHLRLILGQPFLQLNPLYKLMRDKMFQIMSRSDSRFIVFLSGWENSRQATARKTIATNECSSDPTPNTNSALKSWAIDEPICADTLFAARPI
jgi:hypothetical protein